MACSLLTTGGSCDAGVASLLFSQSRKLKAHCLIVPLKRLLNMHAEAIQTHMHSHPTRDTLMVWGSAVPPQMFPPCLVSVQVACYDPLPVLPSAFLMNCDPLPGFFHPLVFLSRQHLDRVLPTSLFIHFKIKYFFCTHSRGRGEKVHGCLGTVGLVCCSLSKPLGLWEHNSFAL